MEIKITMSYNLTPVRSAISKEKKKVSVSNDVWRRQWHPTPVLVPEKSHGWRSLIGCSPWGREESDTTEQLHFHFSLSCIGEGNGNPLQCYCLDNPRDGGAWWAAVYGVAQSWTRLKRLSSSSSNDVKKREPFHTIDGYVNWYGQYGKQYGDSLKIELS